MKVKNSLNLYFIRMESTIRTKIEKIVCHVFYGMQWLMIFLTKEWFHRLNLISNSLTWLRSSKGDEYAGNAFKVKKAFPCEQKGNLPPSPLDECGEAAEEWLTQFTWACTTRHALNNLASHSNYKENVYYIEHDLVYPEQWSVPGWHRQCYSKSCHCIGKISIGWQFNPWWLIFGAWPAFASRG